MSRGASAWVSEEESQSRPQNGVEREPQDERRGASQSVGLTSGVSIRRGDQETKRRRVAEPLPPRDGVENGAEQFQWPEPAWSRTSRRNRISGNSTFTEELCLEDGALGMANNGLPRSRACHPLPGAHGGWGNRTEGPIMNGLNGDRWADKGGEGQEGAVLNANGGGRHRRGSSWAAWAGWERPEPERDEDGGGTFEKKRFKDHRCCDPGTAVAHYSVDQPLRHSSHLHTEPGPGDEHESSHPPHADPGHQPLSAHLPACTTNTSPPSPSCIASQLASSSCPCASDMPGDRHSPSGDPPERVSHVAVETDFFAPPPPASNTKPPLAPIATSHTTSSSYDTKGTTSSPNSPRLDSKISNISNISEIEKGIYKSLSRQDWVETEQNSVNSSTEHSYRSVIRRNVLDPILTFLSPKFQDKEIEQKFRREVSGPHLDRDFLFVVACRSSLRTFEYTTFRTC